VVNKTLDVSFPCIHIVGSNFNQNQLLALCLEKELKVECTCMAELTMQDLVAMQPEKVRVFLLDCANLDRAALEKCFDIGRPIHPDTLFAALFNVDPGFRIENLVNLHKVRGIFYREDSRQVFLKGIQTILNGQLWLSRRIMSECALVAGEKSSTGETGVKQLSDREKEVLKLVVMGFGNQEIADRMHISPHTVKTHLYKIYRKIGVSNRLQATLCAAAHLC
jgi:DNA-binding NarL/FixJ family response regulator